MSLHRRILFLFVCTILAYACSNYDSDYGGANGGAAGAGGNATSGAAGSGDTSDAGGGATGGTGGSGGAGAGASAKGGGGGTGGAIDAGPSATGGTAGSSGAKDAGADGKGGAAGSMGTDGAVAPTIASFKATPLTLPSAGKSTLTWMVSGADRISIDRGVGAVTGQSIDVNVSATTTYTLTATNIHGSSTASLTVTIGTNSSVDPPGGNRYGAMIAPVDGETFLGPSVDLRLAEWRETPTTIKAADPGGATAKPLQRSSSSMG